MFEFLEPKYNIKKVESKWYSIWEKNGYFHQEIDKLKDPFSIVMPPPNITGSLHLGHAMDNTIQDILIRFKRMEGYNVLWIPGIDHAGIATQARVEKDIKEKEGFSRKDLSKKEFLDKVWEWKKIYHKKIINQLKLLGISCDWKSERFTLDKGCSDAVKEVFLKLYKKKLIYKDKYVINWCPKCLTTISDIEVKHLEKKSFLWYIRYYLCDSSDFIVVATTRPETIFGDTAIAVNPKDKRYINLIGKFVKIPICERNIPIIKDNLVDLNFGTGAVKITPSHDINDFKIAKKHNLEQITVIDKYGKMTDLAKKYSGMSSLRCREIIIDDLKKNNNLELVKSHKNFIGTCYRCNTIIEPLVSTQWFIKMKKFADKSLKLIENKKNIFIPKKFLNIYKNWLKNINDWCISRQLWWGHRIPIWYCLDCGEIISSKKEVVKCIKCNSINLEQDKDVLDTWFSSALWPFSALGWPNKTEILKNFYPISILVTGRDIIFFWVARMLFMGVEFMKKVPFKKIFIHGLVLDRKGYKMSKSFGNGIDPVEIINNYGADSLRFMLVTGNTPGNDICFKEEKLNGARNFCNKIWNAARFVLLNLKNYKEEEINLNKLDISDKWILSKYNESVDIVTRSLNKYELGIAADKIYEFIWSFFCDWYIEISKFRLSNNNKKDDQVVKNILNNILKGSLLMLHPFMPFITEEIWQHLNKKGETIMIAKWPKNNIKLKFTKEKEEMESIIEGIKAIRNLRAEMNIENNKKTSIFLYVEKKYLGLAIKSIPYFENLAFGKKDFIFINKKEKPKKFALKMTSIFKIYLQIEEECDMKIETKRLEKEINLLIKEQERIERKLNNIDFINKAPKEIIKKEQEKLHKYKLQYNFLSKRLENL